MSLWVLTCILQICKRCQFPLIHVGQREYICSISFHFCTPNISINSASNNVPSAKELLPGFHGSTSVRQTRNQRAPPPRPGPRPGALGSFRVSPSSRASHRRCVTQGSSFTDVLPTLLLHLHSADKAVDKAESEPRSLGLEARPTRQNQRREARP